jgi:hypothetical protein
VVLAVSAEVVYEFAVVDAENGGTAVLLVMQLMRYPVAVGTPSHVKIIVVGAATQSVTTDTPPGGCKIVLANIAVGSGQSK